MSIAKRVMDAMQLLKVSAGDLLIIGSLTKKTKGVYSPANGQATVSSKSVPLYIIIDSYSVEDLKDQSILVTDSKFLVLNDGERPESGDLITAKSMVFSVIKPKDICVGEYVPFFEVQCRK